MLDLIPPTIFVGTATPILALHAYLAAPKKKKMFLRVSVILTVAAVVGATLLIWSIEHDRSPQNANGLAAGFSALFSIGVILTLQLSFILVDLVICVPKARSYLDEAKKSGI